MNGQGALRTMGWALGACACVAAVYAAATAALERPDVLRIDAAAASISADYSTDEHQAARRRLDPQIIGAAAADDDALDAGRATDVSSPAPTPPATSVATVTPAPTDTPEPEPTPSDTPEPLPTDTPEPTATDTAEPEPTPTETPTATDTPDPTATPVRCRTPEPFAGLVKGNDSSGNKNSGKRRCPTPTPEPTKTTPAGQ